MTSQSTHIDTILFVSSQKVLTIETRLNAVSGDIKKVLLIKTTSQQSYFTIQQQFFNKVL